MGLRIATDLPFTFQFKRDRSSITRPRVGAFSTGVVILISESRNLTIALRFAFASPQESHTLMCHELMYILSEP